MEQYANALTFQKSIKIIAINGGKINRIRDVLVSLASNDAALKNQLAPNFPPDDFAKVQFDSNSMHCCRHCVLCIRLWDTFLHTLSVAMHEKRKYFLLHLKDRFLLIVLQSRLSNDHSRNHLLWGSVTKGIETPLIAWSPYPLNGRNSCDMGCITW